MDNIKQQKPKKTSAFKRFFRIFSIVLVLFLAIYIYWSYYFTYSEGNRNGLLQKFSHKGNIFKTYEGELVLSSVSSTNNVAIASEKFYFSVTSDSVAARLKELEGHTIVLHYVQKNGTLPWRGESEYIVDSIVHINK
jgi:hypothetical protein